ncbi:hypothetical protein GCM10027578_22660 [Spirosoma luteolum]
MRPVSLAEAPLIPKWDRRGTSRLLFRFLLYNPAPAYYVAMTLSLSSLSPYTPALTLQMASDGGAVGHSPGSRPTDPATSPEPRSTVALGETIRREQSRLLAFIRKRLPDPDDAEDVMQDVFMELTEAYQLARPIERVASWLFAVARNKISDWYRRARPNGDRTVSISPPDTDDDSDGTLLLEWLAIADDAGPESEFFRETVMEALADALAELPAEQRDTFVQHELEGRSFSELSAAWGVAVNTLLSRKRYAVLHLRKRLRELYDDFLDRN